MLKKTSLGTEASGAPPRFVIRTRLLTAWTRYVGLAATHGSAGIQPPASPSAEPANDARFAASGMLTIAGDGFVIVDRTTGALDGRPKLAFSVGSEAVGRCGAPAVAATAAIDGMCARAETVLWMPVDWPKVRLLVAGTAEATGATVDRAMAATAVAAPKRAVA